MISKNDTRDRTFRIAAGDDISKVYLSESSVYRAVEPRGISSVTEVMNALGKKFEGVIETGISKNKKVNSVISENGQLVLVHRRIKVISYPHEWCALMLKDAAKFHLDLMMRLLKRDLFLKDCHPLNILFERGRPIFVDYTSIVTKPELLKEAFLNKSEKSEGAISKSGFVDLIKGIFIQMFMPYFSKPLFFYAFGNREKARKRIENTTLNTATDIIALKQLFPRKFQLSGLVRLVALIWFYLKERFVFLMFRLGGNFPKFLSRLRHFIEGLPVSVGESSYSDYYRAKGENQSHNYSEDWNDKQKSVYKAIYTNDINTVLDIACNTGWFALMAEKLGKSVIAFDVDEGCVEILYQEVRDGNLDILPLVMNFTNLTQDRFSIYDGNPVVLNAESRLKSDSVIALGILHHLVLGLGLRVEEIVKTLDSLAVKQIVLEYIDLNDEKILEDPNFFPEYFKDPSIADGYDLENIRLCLENLGFKVNVENSYPSTRKILVCEK